MNIQYRKSLLLMLMVFLTLTVQGQKAYSLKSHKISVNGTSTVHDWESDVTKFEWSGQLATDGIESTLKNVGNGEGSRKK